MQTLLNLILYNNKQEFFDILQKINSMSDSSDDECAPIDITSWGSQAPSHSNNPAEEDTSKGWDSIRFKN